MTSLVARPRLPARVLPQGAALIALGLGLALVLSAGVAVGLGDGGPPLGLTLAAGVGALGVLALALGRYDAAVARVTPMAPGHTTPQSRWASSYSGSCASSRRRSTGCSRS